MRNEVEYVSLCENTNRILMVTMGHLYIGERCANDFREMWHLIRETLEVMCTVWERRGRVPRRWSTLKLACSLKVLRLILMGWIHVASWN